MQITAIAGNNEGLDGGPKKNHYGKKSLMGSNMIFHSVTGADPGFLDRGFKFRKGFVFLVLPNFF